jgi:hypothetical protein
VLADPAREFEFVCCSADRDCCATASCTFVDPLFATGAAALAALLAGKSRLIELAAGRLLV